MAGVAGRRGRWLVAASVAVALIGGSLAYRVSLRMDAEPASLAEAPARSELAPEEAREAAREKAREEALSDESAAFTAPQGLRRATASGERAGDTAVGDTAVVEQEPIPASPDSGIPDPVTAKPADDWDPNLEAFIAPESDTVVVLEDGLEVRYPAGTLYVAGARRDQAAAEQERTEAPSAAPQEGLAQAQVPSEALLEAPRRMRQAPEARVGAAAKSRAYVVAPPSTGGTTEPNDQPYGDMFFESYGVNPFIDTEDDNLSTFGLDVDTASYTMARGYLEGGHLPPPPSVRVEEMVNFFDYGDAPPRRGDFAITAEGAPTPFAEGPRYRLLRFNVRGREISTAERLPATLIFVVDVSGSMQRENRLGLVKRSLGLLLDQLRPDDRVGLVVYGSQGDVLLEPTGDLEAIRSAIERLQPRGSTNAEEGLVLGYGLAERYFREGAINRLVLCSDGVANVGRTGPDSILTRIGTAAEGGIELTTVGFGMGNYNDVLMEQLADRGDGNYAYVDTLDEARRVFVENLTGTLQTIAREAKIQVEFNPEVVSRYRLLGYENRDIADELFRDDTVDAGEIGAGHSVTALYEIKLRDGGRARAELATLRLRYHSMAVEEVVETAQSLRVGDLEDSWEEASAALRLASVVAEYAEILRRSFWAKQSDPEELFRRAQRVSAEFAGDIEVADFVSLVGRAARLVPPPPEAGPLED